MTPTSALKKATSLEDLRRVCKPSPLTGDDLQFFVETSEARDPHQQARQLLRIGLEVEPARLLLYGHRGCGKSTELNMFLSEHGDKFFPVKFSVLDTMTPVNALAEDLMLVIAERLLAAATAGNLAANEATLREVYDYFAEQTRKATEEERGEVKASAGVDTGASYLGKLVGLFAKFSGEIKMDSHSEETAVFTLRKRPAELVAKVNRVIEAVRAGLPTGKKLLIVVEDMDKLDLKQARDMYVNNVNLLTELAAHVIYTIPIHLIHSPDLGAFKPRFDATIALPMIKVSEPGAATQPVGHQVVCDIVLQRVEESLFEEGALDSLVTNTGGVLRHAFEVLHIVSTMSTSDTRITKGAVRYGLNQLRKECLQQIALPLDPIPDGPKSVTELYDRLVEYAKQQRAGMKPLPTTDATNQILLKVCALLEYNGEGWFGVHPLVMESLEQMGRLKRDGQ